MLSDAGSKDASLVDDIAAGFRLTGTLHKSHEYATQLRPATISRDTLLKMASELNENLVRKAFVSVEAELNEKVLFETQSECEKGWLSPALTKEELDERFPEGWLASRRFPLKQGSKVRLIDDFSASMVNAATTVVEKLSLEGVDQLLASIKLWVSRAESLGVWSKEDATHLCGKCFDLSAAYRQLAVHPDDHKVAIIAVPTMSEDVSFHVMHALPFGATSSVYSFNRASLALRMIMLKIFMIPLVSYFDDYPAFSPVCLKDDTEATAQEVFRLLGWTVTTDERKTFPFSSSFTALGVEIDLRKVPGGLIEVHNKPGRVEAIKSSIGEVLKAGTFSKHEASSLKGKMQFADSQHYCRLGCITTRMLSNCVAFTKGDIRVTDELRTALEWFAFILDEAPSRCLKLKAPSRPKRVYTDGACEGTNRAVGTFGGILFDESKERPEFFAGSVPTELMQVWSMKGSKQNIFLVELLPVLIAKTVWAQSFAEESVLYFIDNEAARLALISCSTPNQHAMEIISKSMRLDAKARSRNWYARVPSFSNAADGPSRGELHATALKWNAVQVQVQHLLA
eukprot:6390812-Amphidinium_carterae.2